MGAQHSDGPAGLRGPFRVAGRTLRRTITRLAERGRRLPDSTRRALAVAAAAAVFLASYAVFSTVSPRLREWSRGWGGNPSPLDEVFEEPQSPGADTGGQPSPGGIEVEVGDDLTRGAAGPDVPVTASAPEPGDFVWPVQGSVQRGFGWGYDETMADYRFHRGADVVAPAGTRVRAAYGGTVTAVRRDGRWGWVVEISHGHGLVSRYAGLARALVEQGSVVETGQDIGEVGNTAAIEAGQPAHVHFELLRDGEPMDPATMYPAEGS